MLNVPAHQDDYHDFSQIDIGILLPSSAPALAHLRDLALDGFQLQDEQLSAAMLGAMTSLTLLRISRSNCTSIPSDLPAAASLRVLCLAFNAKFKFCEDAITVIMSLPQLETLKLSMDEGRSGWGLGSVASIMKLREKLPALEIVLDDAVDDPLTETSKDVWSRELQS